MLNLVFLGPPGAGKGTQASLLAGRRGLCHISTGDLFRSAVEAGTALGRQAQGFLDEGRLVPDEIVCGMVREKLQEPETVPGFILDGFPRTLVQAETLARDLEAMERPLTAVIDFILEDQVAVDRIQGRARKARSGDGEVRADDTPETVQKRLSVYREKTAPLTAWYEARGLLRKVPASGTIDEIQAALERVLGAG